MKKYHCFLLVLIIKINRFAEKHDRNAKHGHNNTHALHIHLSWIEDQTLVNCIIGSYRAILQKEHVYKLDEQIGRTRAVQWITAAIVFDPLDYDHDAQVNKYQRNEYYLRYELEQNADLAAEINMIEQAEHQAENHLHDAYYDGEFHLHRVGERYFVDAKLPDGVHAERIRIA